MTRHDQSVGLILNELDAALSDLDGDQRLAFLALLRGARHVFVCGVGRVMLAMRAFAKRLNHLGIPAHYVGENSEPALEAGDLVVVGSGSGRSIVPLAIAQKAGELGATVVHVAAAADTPLARFADLTVIIRAASTTGGAPSRQPMTSLFEQALLVYLDSICLDLWSEASAEDQRRMSGRHATLE